MTKVYAKFIGANKSLGYLKGKKYHLNMMIIDKGELEVAPVGNTSESIEDVCVYASLHSFLSNWKVLG